MNIVPLFNFMTKWEHLVVGGMVIGRLNASDERAQPIGFKMNDEKVLFETTKDKNGWKQFDRDGENYKKWHSFEQHQLLNELGSEGWELIKIRGRSNPQASRYYFFRRPL